MYLTFAVFSGVACWVGACGSLSLIAVVCWYVVECCLSAVVGYSASYWCRGEYIVECSLCWVHGSLCMCKAFGGFV